MMNSFHLRSFQRSGIALLLGTSLVAFSLLSLFNPGIARAADTLSSAVYMDVDGDGTVEHIKLTFDTNITQCDFEPLDWAVNTAGDMTVAVTGIDITDPEGTGEGDCNGSDAIVYLAVSATADITGSALDPNITYTQATGTADSLQDSGAITDKTFDATDGAAPVVLSAVYRDDTENGRIDQIVITTTADTGLSCGALDEGVDLDFTENATQANLGAVFNTLDLCDSIDGTSTFTIDLSTQGAVNRTGWTGSLLMNYTAPLGDGFQDGATNFMASFASQTVDDNANPVILSMYYDDTDGDGDVNAILISTTDENASHSCTPFTAEVDLTFSDGGDFILVEDAGDTCEIISNTSVRINLGVSGPANMTGSTTDVVGTIAAGAFNDAAGNGVVESVDATIDDGASPMIVSVTPASGASSVLNSSSIVINFSEAVETTFAYDTEFTTSPNSGGWSAAVFSNADKTVTLAHTSPFTPCSTVSVNVDQDAVEEGGAGTLTLIDGIGPASGDWSFSVRCSSSSSGGGSTTAPTYEVSLTSPNGGESLAPGVLHNVTWTNGGTGTGTYVDLLLSTNGGESYTYIVRNAVNSSSYSWLVPNIATSQARIRIESTDLAEVLAVDASNANFTITGTGTTPITTDEPSPAPSSGQRGLSPVTGLEEDISVVNPGDYIKSPYFSTVYYVDAGMNRHPFMDAMTYFTWQNSFGAIKIVTDATLPTMDLTAPMLPKAGVVLVKIQSDPKVYALEADPSNELAPKLRWVTSENIAQTLYGSDWADYVIDVQVTLFGRFGQGSDITSINSISVDKSIMKKRVNLK